MILPCKRREACMPKACPRGPFCHEFAIQLPHIRARQVDTDRSQEYRTIMQLRHVKTLSSAKDGMHKVTAICWSPNNKRMACVTVDFSHA